MSNLVPPLLSDTPPPPPGIDDQEDDEFGDFTGTNNYHYDSLSPPGSPLQLPIEAPLDGENCTVQFDFNLEKSKDFCDKRKEIGCDLETDKIPNGTASKIENFEAESDDFGDFAASISCAETSNNTASKQDDTTTSTNFDNFGTFATTISCNNDEINKTTSNTATSLNFVAEFDDFGTFTTTNSCNNDEINKTTSNTATSLNFEAEFDDFGTFTTTTSCNNDEINKTTSNTATNLNFEAEFDNFGAFTTPNLDLDNTVTSFDDFGDFATAPKLLLLNDKEALQKATTIVQEMFPKIQKTIADFQEKDSKIQDKIFERIKNITETHALSFQWPKSASQKLLLKSLNIDLRNVGWNPSMPRFASNLSYTPLQPIKSAPNLEPLPNCKPQKPKTVVLRETHISNDISWLEPTILTPEMSRKDSPSMEEDCEDDFGEFTHSLPQPLKPLPAKPVGISWPDPGITDDEITRFEALGLARQKPPVEEEWTDFVSNQKSPLHKVQKERCSTPDLPLSVLNLGAVQPPKQPVPIVTPNGLVQTKLATARAKSRQPVKPQPQTRLNIISNQFANQALGQFDQYAASSKNEDEEWSDFVSASAAMPDLNFSNARK